MNKGLKSKAGLHIQIGKYMIEQTTAETITVSCGSRQRWFPKMVMAVNWVCKDKSLSENCVTDLGKLKDIYQENWNEIKAALGDYPF